MKNFARVSLIALCAFAGGVAAQTVFTVSPALATASTQAATKLFSYFQMGDPTSPKALEFSVSKGVPLQNFLTPDNVIRMQSGLYAPAGEIPTPIITLNDNRGAVKMVLRLSGENQSPVLVFKDKNQKDRMVMGLSLTGTEEPFLTTVDSQGKQTSVIGNFKF